MRSKIQVGFEERHSIVAPTTTSQLLGLLFAYARGARHITEIGVSNPHTTFALLHALEDMGSGDRTLVSIDIQDGFPSAIRQVGEIAKEAGISFEFVVGDSGVIDIGETDFLFIDSDHSREHLLKELDRHSGKVRGLIAFHDTEGPCNLLPFVMEWLGTPAGRGWRVRVHYAMSHGLTVIERRGDDEVEEGRSVSA